MKQIETSYKKWREWYLLFIFAMITMTCFQKLVIYAEILKSQLYKLEFVASGDYGRIDCTGARLAQKDNMRKDHPLEFVNWTQMAGMQVSASGLGNVEECDIMLLCGRSDLLFPGYAVLDMGCQYSCLISSALSDRLFGGKNTSGLIIEAQGRKLEVLDVIDSEEIFLVYEASENDTYSFDRATVQYVSGEFNKTVESFRQLCGEWKRMETRVFVWAAQIMCAVVPGIMWIYFIVLIKKYTKEENTDKTEKIIWKLLLYLLLIGGVYFCLREIRIPEDIIPVKWSDSEFWIEYKKNLSISCQTMVRSEKKIPDMLMLKQIMKLLQWAAAAIIGEIFFLWRLYDTEKSIASHPVTAD